MGDEKLSFPLCTDELQGGFLLPPALGVAQQLQAARATNAETQEFIIALEIPGGSTNLLGAVASPSPPAQALPLLIPGG